MENHLPKLEKAMKISIIAGALIVALSVAYYLAVFLPKKEAMRSAQLREEQILKDQKEKADKEDVLRREEERKSALEHCLFGAEKHYLEFAKLNGTEKKDGTIWASKLVWDRAEKNKKEYIDSCFRQYQPEKY